MNGSESRFDSAADPAAFADDVPVADAAEQARPALPQPEADLETGSETPAAAPLEADSSDWREQHQAVDDFGEDEFR